MSHEFGDQDDVVAFADQAGAEGVAQDVAAGEDGGLLGANVAARDESFAADLDRLGRPVRKRQVPEPDAAGDGVVNQVLGSVSGTVVQARDVHGDIRLGPPAAADPRRPPDQRA
ncbi:hypothetical protein ACIBJE_03675 [Micromonospora sp. NPDC050187]|uniref:hypothetical protein n=1 Tax=Micromonospora sp. NPDC050187 TaxID=3364277 RepID=UPI0037915E21